MEITYTLNANVENIDDERTMVIIEGEDGQVWGIGIVGEDE